jgi:hypothetical protein
VIIRCFLTLLLSSPAFASWKTGGSLESYFKQYSFSAGENYPNQSGGLNAELKADWKRNRQWKFKSDLELRSDLASKDASEKFQFNPESFYLENKTTPVSVRAGYQTVVPDGPDILNPADVIHSRNWTDPTAPKNLSSLGLSLSQEIEEWQWELFYIPTQTKPVLPGEHSPWWPREKRLPIESENTEIQIPKDIRYEISDSLELDQALKNNVAFRIQRKSESFEAQAVYFEGLSQDPYLLLDAPATLIEAEPKQILRVDSPVKLKPLYFRRQVAAGTFLLPVKSWVVKGGANWNHPMGSDTRIPGDSSTYVLGLERNIETRKGIMTFILQHEEQKKLDKQQISFMRSLFENAWSLGFRIPWGEETQFMVGVVYDTIGKQTIYRLSGDRRLSDSWTLGIQETVLEGPPESLLGLYDQYDNFGLNLSYHF